MAVCGIVWDFRLVKTCEYVCVMFIKGGVFVLYIRKVRMMREVLGVGSLRCVVGRYGLFSLRNLVLKI